MNLCMAQVLSSPEHTLYTLSNSHAQHASGPMKSWTDPMHTQQKPRSTCLKSYQVLATHYTHSSEVMLNMAQVLSSPRHNLYTLIKSHAQHASCLIKSWTHPMHTHHKSCSRVFIPVLSTLAKSWKQPNVPIHSSVYKLWYSYVTEYCRAVKKTGFQLREALAVGHRRYHTYVSVHLRFKNG